MFCTRCGSKVSDDDAIFCAYCGYKLHREENEATTPIIKPESKICTMDNENKEVASVMEQMEKVPEKEVVPVNIMVQPVPDTMAANEISKQTEGIEGNGSTTYMPYENQQYVEMEQSSEDVNEKKNIIAFSVLSVIFALFTIAASVFEMLDARSEMQDIARLIEISITAIILIVYAFLNNRTVSVLKGIAVVIAMAADIIFVGFSSIQYSIESLTSSFTVHRLSIGNGKEEWIIAAFFISMLVWFGAMYIFFIIDAIRSFIGTRNIKTFTLFFGFVAAVAIVANIIFRAIIEDSVTLYLEIVPMNLGYVFLILTMCFGFMEKKKLKNKEHD